ncbi:Detected protein of confused Function [Hibiscus syriacus]|uniref:Detected protein of confused Function n=1 Tax=Hibiscus syriacus TaxID=106335 RepID=A0A6A3DAD4_HIBSY|nr:Detected protein of confused Function [Hibiscus syriacus]
MAMVFDSVTSIKAAYTELQIAQNSYNNNAIQAADQAVVEQLKVLSELKRKLLKHELDVSPQVSLMLAEIQEQQSLIRIDEINIKKLESNIKRKVADIVLHHKQLKDCTILNRSMEKKLNESGLLSMFDNIKFTTLNPSDFVQVLHFTMKYVRSFVRLMMKEMEIAKWDVDVTAKNIEPGFVSHDFGLTKEEYFNEFKSLKTAKPKSFLVQNPYSFFAKFAIVKYIKLVHPRMECSFFGNLNQKKLVINGGFPDTTFFIAYEEMGMRFWLLRCLGFSMSEQVSLF